MKQSIFIRLNSLFTLVFLVFFVIILISVNPFKASIFVLILFYLVFFGLVLGILNLIGFYLKLPFWFRLLAAISLLFLLILQSFRF
jgi:hypothetical protein